MTYKTLDLWWEKALYIFGIMSVIGFVIWIMLLLMQDTYPSKNWTLDNSFKEIIYYVFGVGKFIGICAIVFIFMILSIFFNNG